jgi:hypothetical protein
MFSYICEFVSSIKEQPVFGDLRIIISNQYAKKLIILKKVLPGKSTLFDLKIFPFIKHDDNIKYNIKHKYLHENQKSIFSFVNFIIDTMQKIKNFSVCFNIIYDYV